MVNVGGSRMSTFEVGQVLEPQTFIINRELLVGYANASGDQNPIHQDEEFAKSVGLENVIAHGMFTMALAGRYASSFAGSAAVRELSARFVKPVVVPANTDVELIVSGKVLDITENVMKIELTAITGGIKVLGMAKAVIALS
jgi:acyl dehydratase